LSPSSEAEGGGAGDLTSFSPTWADAFEISCTHDCGSSLTVFIAPIVMSVLVLISAVGYFVFHSLFDSSYKRTNSSSDHGSNSGSFGVDILDDEDDYDTVFLNDANHNSSSINGNGNDFEDEDVMNEIMMCISEVHKEDGQITLEHDAKGGKHGSSPSSSSFASPFVARTFNNMMKVKSMNVKSPTRKNGYQNVQSNDNNFVGFSDGIDNKGASETGGVEMNSADFSCISSKEDDDFFAAIDNFSLDSPVPVSKADNDIDQFSPPDDSNNPFDMSLHNDDFAV
jgi:hypothetical protein